MVVQDAQQVGPSGPTWPSSSKSEVRQTARALAEKLYGMDEDQIRQFVQELPSVQGVMRSRDVYYYGDTLVLKVAPNPDAPCLYEHPQVTCDCFDTEECPFVHAEEIEDCLCMNKQESSSYGTGQNEAEALLWHSLNGEYRMYFAEVFADSGDGLWLIQEKVVPLQGYEQMPLVLRDVADAVGVGDVKKQNCGHRLTTDGRGRQRWEPVIFDYGISRLWQRITGATHPDLIASEQWRVVQLPDA